MTKCFVHTETSHQWCSKGCDDDEGGGGGEEEELRAGLQLAGCKKAERWICRFVFFPDSNFQHNSLHLPCPLWTRQPAWKENSGRRWAPLGLWQKNEQRCCVKKSTDWKTKASSQKNRQQQILPTLLYKVKLRKDPIYGMCWFALFIHPFIYLLEIPHIICKFNLKFFGIS